MGSLKLMVASLSCAELGTAQPLLVSSISMTLEELIDLISSPYYACGEWVVVGGWW